MPTPTYPTKPLHVELQVEVNDHGQVVRVPHGTLSGNHAFDFMTLGNAMQMWIRHPDGTAQVGLYRVTYDYNPKTHNITRHDPTLIKAGGNWAKKPGAATLIVHDAQRMEALAEKRLQAEEAKRQAQQAKNLPDINAAVKRAMYSATPTPHP